jgi:hypothetical protein
VRPSTRAEGVAVADACVRPVAPSPAEATDLLAAPDAYQTALYPPASTHLLPPAALAAGGRGPAGEGARRGAGGPNRPHPRRGEGQADQARHPDLQGPAADCYAAGARHSGPTFLGELSGSDVPPG